MTKHDQHLRAKAQILLQQNYSIRKVAETLNVTKKFVQLWKTRKNSQRKYGSGRPTKLNPIMMQKIIRDL